MEQMPRSRDFPIDGHQFYSKTLSIMLPNPCYNQNSQQNVNSIVFKIMKKFFLLFSHNFSVGFFIGLKDSIKNLVMVKFNFILKLTNKNILYIKKSFIIRICFYKYYI
jgi:hypothetical protein